MVISPPHEFGRINCAVVSRSRETDLNFVLPGYFPLLEETKQLAVGVDSDTWALKTVPYCTVCSGYPLYALGFVHGTRRRRKDGEREFFRRQMRHIDGPSQRPL